MIVLYVLFVSILLSSFIFLFFKLIKDDFDYAKKVEKQGT